MRMSTGTVFMNVMESDACLVGSDLPQGEEREVWGPSGCLHQQHTTHNNISTSSTRNIVGMSA